MFMAFQSAKLREWIIKYFLQLQFPNDENSSKSVVGEIKKFSIIFSFLYFYLHNKNTM